MTENESTPDIDMLLYRAWGVIANAGWDESDKTEGWQEAAVAWRDAYHAYLDAQGSRTAQ